MAWSYLLRLSSPRDAKTIEQDWESVNEAVAPSYGGTIASGTHAVVVTSQQESSPSDIVSATNYVESVDDGKEIPNRSDTDFDPPIKLGFEFFLAE